MTPRSIEDRLEALEHRAEIANVLCRYATGIDRRQWDSFRRCFGPVVRINLFRTGGWVVVDRDELVRRVRHVFEMYDATQHLSTNHQIEINGDEASASSTLNATHHIRGEPGGQFHQQVGYYEHRLTRRDGWRIDSIEQVGSWQRGNQTIFDRTLDVGQFPGSR